MRIYRGACHGETNNNENAALKQLTKDADEILHLIKVQLDNLTLPSCPLYEEVLDTQMFGLQKKLILLLN